MIVSENERGTLSGTGLILLFVCLFLLVGCYQAQGTGLGRGATPAELRPGYREIYLDLAARAYEADPALDLDMVLGPGWTDEELSASRACRIWRRR